MTQAYESKLRKTKLGTTDPLTGVQETTDRGLYREEIRKMLDAPYDTLPETPTATQVRMADRDHLLMAMLLDTWARIDELMAVRVEDIDLQHRTVRLRKTKRKLRKGEAVQEERTTSFTQDTKVHLIRHLQERRTGRLFEITDRAARKRIHGYAVAQGVQKILGFDAQGKPRFLVTPKAFREAGEAYAVMDGMDRAMAAKRAGHSVEVQERNYTKFDAIRARDLVDRHGNGFR